MFSKRVVTLLTLALACLSSQAKEEADEAAEYGVDVSFPIQHNKVSTNYAWLPHNLDITEELPKEFEGEDVQHLGNRQTFYNDFLKGCVDHFGNKGNRCISTEKDRIEMALRQPQSMQNYTHMGFKKIKAPPEVFKMIKEFWDKNKDKRSLEQWGVGNTYTNNWASPTYMVSVEDSKLRGGGVKLKQQIWDSAYDTVSRWTEQQLTECSLYGIRVYTEGAVLATHVDRLPLVSSAIINVASDLDEPWPLEVYGHDGYAYNVTMEPGDMVLYESHSVLHGRPFPLKGRFVANIFIHFEPTGHSLRHAGMEFASDIEAQYKKSAEDGRSGHEHDQDGLPPYIIPGTPEEKHYRELHPNGYKAITGRNPSFGTGSTPAHFAAQQGHLEDLKLHLHNDADVIHKKDENGWTPLHEAVRGGHIEVIRFLIDQGANVNARTGAKSDGGSVLWWAKNTHEEDSEIVHYLMDIGALEAGPEL